MRNTLHSVALAAALLAAGGLLYGLASHGMTPSAPAPEARSEGGTTQGIGVRGLWKIQVRDPDGTVVQRRSFENAYVDGENILVRILTSQVTPGEWEVRLSNSAGTQNICEDGDGSRDVCSLTSPDFPLPDGNTFNTLVTSTDAQTIVLAGSAVASFDGAIDRVQTYLNTCAADTLTPTQCGPSPGGSFAGFFTLHSFGDVIPVLEGQQVSAEVRLVFGAAP